MTLLRVASSSSPSSAMTARRSPRAFSTEWRGRRGDVVDEEVVDGDVERFGDADDGVEGWGDAAVLVAADALRVGADAFGELGLGPAGFLA